MTKKNICFFFLLLFFQLEISLSTENDTLIHVEILPRWNIGLAVPLNFNYSFGSLGNNNDNQWCCNSANFSGFHLNSGINTTSQIYIKNFNPKYFFDSLSWGYHFNLSYESRSLSGSVIEPPRNVLLNNQIVNLFEKNNLKLKLDIIKIGAGFLLGSPLDTNQVLLPYSLTKPRYYFYFYPKLSILLNNNSIKSVEIVSPNDYTYLDGTKEKVLKEGSIDYMNLFVFGIDFGLGADWYLNQIFNKLNNNQLIVGADLGFGFNFNGIAKNSTLNFFEIFLKLNIKWEFSEILQVSKNH